MLAISDFRPFQSRKSWSRAITALLSLYMMAGVCSSVLRGLGHEKWGWTYPCLTNIWESGTERDTDRAQCNYPHPFLTVTLKGLFSPPLLQHLSPTLCPPLSPFISDWATEFKIIRSGFQAGKCIQTCYQCYHRSSSPSQSLSLSFFISLSVLYNDTLSSVLYALGEAVSAASCHHLQGWIFLKCSPVLGTTFKSNFSIAQLSIIYPDGVNCWIKEWFLSVNYYTASLPHPILHPNWNPLMQSATTSHKATESMPKYNYH